MSARDPPNLRRWVEWRVKKAGKQGKRVAIGGGGFGGHTVTASKGQQWGQGPRQINA